MSGKPRRTAAPRPVGAMKGLPAVPADDVEEPKAIYGREKQLRQQKRQTPAPRPAA